MWKNISCYVRKLLCIKIHKQEGEKKTHKMAGNISNHISDKKLMFRIYWHILNIQNAYILNIKYTSQYTIEQKECK